MTTTQRTVKELIDHLRIRRWSDAAIAEELGVKGVTVYRWRQDQRGIQRPNELVRRALEELLRRP